MSNRNKKVAAISAVMSYLRQEEEAVAFQQFSASNDSSVSTTSHSSPAAWSMSGRQAQMQLRSLMQMKALYRFN